jgi:prepilin-type N-terminal cleavage/methylation domain-containing protein
MTRRRLGREEGFTLIELLAGMAIGLVVIAAAFAMLDASMRTTLRTQQRVETVQRGRGTMDLMTRQLRSQVCLGKVASLVQAKSDSVTFYADLTDGSTGKPPQRRTLAFAGGRITQTIEEGTGMPPATQWLTAPVSTRLLDDAAPDPAIAAAADGTTPIFRYYAFTRDPIPLMIGPLATPVAASVLPSIVKISISFGVRHTGAPATDVPRTVMHDDVYIRSADPNLPSPSPLCA